MAKQTAVQFLVMRYNQWQGVLKDRDIEEAKAMEKEQMQQPIIRPTDEDITKKSLQYSQWYDIQKPFYNGARWMLEHIIKINR